MQRDIPLDAAFAELNVGRKLWRRVRAELKLEDDLVSTVYRLWRCDSRRVQSALSRLLPDVAVQAVLGEFYEESTSSAESTVAAETTLSIEATFDEGCVSSKQTSAMQESFASIKKRLPRMALWKAEGQDQRNKAFKRRLKEILTEKELKALKALGLDFRVAGPKGAFGYLEKVWSILNSRSDIEDLLIEVITAQPDADLERALRAALSGEAVNRAPVSDTRSGPNANIEDGSLCIPHRRWGPGSRRRVKSMSESQLLDLADAQLLQIFEFCAYPQTLCAVGSLCSIIRRIAEIDRIWSTAWRGSNFLDPPPETNIRMKFLQVLMSQCIECGNHTDFEHAIIGCRLCECCEKSLPQYALIRPSIIAREFHLDVKAMRSLPHLDGSTGRVYLRAHVENLAATYHTQQSLQRLRARHDIGRSGYGRQRQQGGRRRQRTSSEDLYGDDGDPCCFEATALRRANEA